MSKAAGDRVLFVGSECFPLIKTGGLADVMGALPLALATRGLDVRVLLPGFPAVMKAAKNKRKAGTLKKLFGQDVTLLTATSDSGLKLLIAEADIFDIEGNPYLDKAGENRADNGLRYAAFAKIAAEVALGNAIKWQADIVHAHDWQAGLTALYLQLAKPSLPPRTVFTIHNLAFQGLFPKSLMPKIGLPASVFSQDGIEYWDKASFLKAGVIYSDHITTVSPTYAREIQTEEGGMGFGGLLKNRSQQLSGIVNGIDTDVWDPATDPDLTTHFSAKAPAGKRKAKRALLKEYGLTDKAPGPLFGIVSRLTQQKGLDLVAAAIPHIVGNHGQLIVIGSGDAELETVFRQAAATHPEMIGTFIGYDEARAHRLQAGVDLIMVPSRFEPCGLTQLCGLRYGALPLVARVGGLADTVIDANMAARRHGAGTGIQFAPVTFDDLIAAIDRSFALYADGPTWIKLRRNAMREDVSWAEPAAAYHALYESLKPVS